MIVALRVIASHERKDKPLQWCDQREQLSPTVAGLVSSRSQSGPVLRKGDMQRCGQAPIMKTESLIRVAIAFLTIAVALECASRPALSFNFEGMWVGNIKGFAANHTQMDVYSPDHRRSLLFVIAPGTPITSADGSMHYKPSDLKVGTLVRVHVNMPYGWGYYGYGVTIGAMYITRIDILTGAAIHHNIQQSLKQTLPSPSPRPSGTEPPPVPIIFVSPSPKAT